MDGPACTQRNERVNDPPRDLGTPPSGGPGSQARTRRAQVRDQVASARPRRILGDWTGPLHDRDQPIRGAHVRTGAGRPGVAVPSRPHAESSQRHPLPGVQQLRREDLPGRMPSRLKPDSQPWAAAEGRGVGDAASFAGLPPPPPPNPRYGPPAKVSEAKLGAKETPLITPTMNDDDLQRELERLARSDAGPRQSAAREGHGAQLCLKFRRGGWVTLSLTGEIPGELGGVSPGNGETRSPCKAVYTGSIPAGASDWRARYREL